MGIALVVIMSAIGGVTEWARHQPPYNASLVQAALSGDLSTVRGLLMKGVRVNAVDEDGRTSLMMAAVSNHQAIVHYLLQRGANPNQRDGWGDTALHRVARTEAWRHAPEAVIGQLVQAGADVNARGGEGQTPLMEAAKAGNVDVARLLLVNGADPQLRDHYGRTAAVYAAGVDGMERHPEVGMLLHNALRFGRRQQAVSLNSITP